MKKIVFIIVMSVLQAVAVDAQNSYHYSTDTIPCGVRQRNYYYNSWYDTNDFYLRPDGFSFSSPDLPGNFMNLESLDDQGTLIRFNQQFAPRRIRIKGLWAMVKHDAPRHVIIRDSTRLPEYLYLCLTAKEWPQTHSTEKFLKCVDSVRWDTAEPKMLCVKQTADGRKRNFYCHVYEALFDTVYTMAGEFWIGGSENSNANQDHVYGGFEHWPTYYVIYSPGYILPPPIPYNNKLMCFGGINGLYDGFKDLQDMYNYKHSPFGVILDEQQYYVELPSADTARGVAKPTAFYPAGSYQTITAVPNCCYRFSHWSDGSTENPRTILVTQDTSIVAYFDTVSHIFDVAVHSNDTSLGDAMLLARPVYPLTLPMLANPFYRTVGSDSSYCEGDSVIFKAEAHPGAYFWYWNDSVRENPRTLTVTQDTQLTAIFKTEVPPVYVPPCPRISKPLVVVMDTGRVLLTWAQSWTTNFRRHVGWEVAWGLAGTSPDSCEIFSCSHFDKEFANLDVGVHYVAYVRALCEHNNSSYYSDWSDSVDIYFPPNRYTVATDVNYAERGRVYGGGEYGEGEVAVLTASAERHYSFLQWNDGVEANPRFVEVTQDTAFTALFSEWERIASVDSPDWMFQLLPNPASGSVLCAWKGDSFSSSILTMTDASGRKLLRKEIPPQTTSYSLILTAYPKGVYFVTLTTMQGVLTQRLVIE